MEEKKTIKVSLSTVFLILAIGVIIIMGYYTYNIYEQNETANEEIKNLKTEISELEKSIKNYKDKLNAINSLTNNSVEDISVKAKSEIKSTIQKYFDIRQILSSDTLNVLVELGLKTETQNSENYKGFSHNEPYPNSYFIITDISYSDFENAVSKYMTLELFNSEYPNYTINKDGVLCIYSDGGTSGSMKVKDCNISNSDSGIYTCDVTISTHRDDDGSNSEEKFIITVIEQNGKYIVSKITTEQ